MKRNVVLALLSLVAILGARAGGSTAREDGIVRLRNAAQALQEVASTPDHGIPDEVVARAKCIVVVPHLVKAGLVIGGKYGRGVATCRTTSGPQARGNAGWSAPAFITIGGGTWGPQIGAEDVDLVMMVMNDQGLQQLLSDKVHLTLEASAVAGPVGRHASVGEGWKQDTEILTYARTKGAFVGQTLEGAVVEADEEATRAIYGSDVSFNKILRGQVPPPASVAPFLKAVAEISHQAAAQQARQQTPESSTK